MHMPAVPVGSLGKKGLISLVAVVAALLLGGPAAAAEAATISVTRLITGQGSVSGAGTTCTHSTANESATLNCGQRTFPGGSFVFLDVTAQPGSSPAGHWSFAGWSGCSGGNAAPL